MNCDRSVGSQQVSAVTAIQGFSPGISRPVVAVFEMAVGGVANSRDRKHQRQLSHPMPAAIELGGDPIHDVLGAAVDRTC